MSSLSVALGFAVGAAAILFLRWLWRRLTWERCLSCGKLIPPHISRVHNQPGCPFAGVCISCNMARHWPKAQA